MSVALADGWGEPVEWLGTSLASFKARGQNHIAAACQALLAKVLPFMTFAVDRILGESGVRSPKLGDDLAALMCGGQRRWRSRATMTCGRKW
jgi:hypothetical protein